MKDSVRKLILIGILVVVCLVIAIRAATYFRFSEVVVMVQDIPAGTKITPEMYETKTVRFDATLLENVVSDPMQLFNGGQPGADNGQYTLTPLLKGETIRKEQLATTPTDSRFGIGSAIGTNQVALAVNLPIENAVGGVIAAGQQVNVVYALTADTGSSSGGNVFNDAAPKVDPKSAITLQAVTVLDVKNENGTKRFAADVASKRVIVVLSVPVNDARQISLAAGGGGMVYLSLPNMTDAQTSSSQSTVPTQNEESPVATEPETPNTTTP